MVSNKRSILPVAVECAVLTAEIYVRRETYLNGPPCVENDCDWCVTDRYLQCHRQLSAEHSWVYNFCVLCELTQSSICSKMSSF